MNPENNVEQTIKQIREEMVTKSDLNKLSESIEKMFHRYANFGNPDVSDLPSLIKDALGNKNISDTFDESKKKE